MLRQPLASGGRGCSQPAAQTVWTRFGDYNIHESIHEPGRTSEVHPAIVLGSSRELAGVLLRRSFDEHTLHSADHPFIDRTMLCVELSLQAGEPLLLHLEGDLIGQRRGGRPGTTAVEEGKRLIQAHVAHERERRREVALGLTRKTR